MPNNKIDMPEKGQYVYIIENKTGRTPIVGQVKKLHSLCVAECVVAVSSGMKRVNASRADIALTKEEAIQKVYPALDRVIKAAEKRIEEAELMNEAFDQAIACVDQLDLVSAKEKLVKSVKNLLRTKTKTAQATIRRSRLLKESVANLPDLPSS